MMGLAAHGQCIVVCLHPLSHGPILPTMFQRSSFHQFLMYALFPSTLKWMLAAIHHGVTENIRKDAMFNACAAFDHGVEIAHDDEIRVGADTAIFKHLTFLLFKRNMIEREKQEARHEDEKNMKALDQNDEKKKDEDDTQSDSNKEMDDIMDEITNTLKGLEMVLRASAECISVSFARIGKELLPIIIGLIQEQCVMTFDACNKVNQASSLQSTSTASSTISVEHVILDSNKAQSDHPVPRQLGGTMLKTATKIIGHFARVGSLTETLAQTKHLLTTLKQVIEIPENEAPVVPLEAKLNCLWIIANLACSADNMIRMASYPGLIDTLVKVAQRPNSEDESQCNSTEDYLKLLRSRSIAVRAILNLSWAHENKVPLIEHPGLVEILLSVASHRRSTWTGNGKGVSTILLQSRRHAAGALRNLAAAPRRYKRRLCRLMDNTFLESLAEIAKNDVDEIVRDKIFATLYNLVSADTAKLFVEKKAVLDVIVGATASDDDSMGEDSKTSSNACSMAVQILSSLEKAIPEDEDDYDALRPILSRFDSQVVLIKSQSTFEMRRGTAA